MAKKKLGRQRPKRVVVRSRAYGKHKRAVRGTYIAATLNEAMKRSGAKTTLANQVAKTIKDAFDPYREGFKDGTMWSRLISLVKRNMDADGVFDYTKLVDFEIHKRFKMELSYFREMKATISKDDGMLELVTITRCALNLSRDQAKEYEKTLVILFLGPDETVASQTVVVPLTPVDYREFNTRWNIPDKARIAIIALRCRFIEQGKAIQKDGRSAMVVQKVINLYNVDFNRNEGGQIE